jgi:acetylornithine/succinyldiaminopimelate/putrescine aminotransferase/predicted amino acid dehydrogenase
MNGQEAYATLVRPKLAELLELIHLNVVFERASGCYLWPKGSSLPVLDLVGGYGTLLFGHNHPQLVNAAVNYLRADGPVHVQGSLKPLTGELAARLSRGRYHVLFASSGACAVEVALKHVLMERQGPIVALAGAFHGKTLGALQLTANPAYRNGFETGLPVVRIPPNDTTALREVFQRHRPAALFLELVQGEGGVVPLTREFVSVARALCKETVLVVDECQTGMGRTGRFLACDHYDLEPDLVLLSKGLSGGIAKLAAVLIRSERWRPELSMLHTSTYADDDLSAAVALAALDLLTEPALAACAKTGRWLKTRLTELAGEYPDVLRGVRGLGLMLGIELATPRTDFLLPLIGSDLGYVVAGYLYHRHRIRIAPTLSNPLTLRIQPPLVTPREELERFVAALHDVCQTIQTGDVLKLTRYFLPGSVPRSEEVRSGCFVYHKDPPTDLPRVGWLFHLNEADDLVNVEPDFALLSSEDKKDYLRHLERRVVPVLMSATDVTSRIGPTARFETILLPLTAGRIRALLDAGDTRWLRRLVQHGIDVAQQRGCRVVSLGQYTSIILRNGTDVRPGRIGVTTGNTYTVALAIEGIERLFPDLGDRTVAVVGAAGNIGAAVAKLLSKRCAELVLVGRNHPASVSRMKRLQIPNARIATSPSNCRQAQVVVVSVSSPTPVVRAEHLESGTLVCDLSVPAGVDTEGRTDIDVIRGGIARLPNGEDFGIPGFPLQQGLAYACQAEGLLLGFENITDRSFTGRITAERVRCMSALAKKHGFGLAEPKRQPCMEVTYGNV